MALKNAGELMKFLKGTKSFDAVFNNLNVLTLSGGKCVAELTVEERHLNLMGGLHGGFSATLVDVLGTYALMSVVTPPHVSVDINTSFIKGAKEGDNILIEAKVLRTGKNLAFLDIDITNKATGELLVKGSHTKFILSGK